MTQAANILDAARSDTALKVYVDIGECRAIMESAHDAITNLLADCSKDTHRAFAFFVKQRLAAKLAELK